jgi:hydroxypyruvate reductase
MIRQRERSPNIDPDRAKENHAWDSLEDQLLRADNSASTPEQRLRRCYDEAIRAVQPERALGRALPSLAAPTSSCWIISVGKASTGMANGIATWLAASGQAPAGGIIVGAEDHPPPHRALRVMTGDHPIPGERSAAAAAAIGKTIDQIPRGASVHVAISGGASALIAGPLPGLTADDVVRTFKALLSSGLDINEMNAIRKRVTAWSAGRLAAALTGRDLHVWVISDVPGDDLGSIASGPCTGDAWTRDDVARLVDEHDLADALTPAVRSALTRETLKPGASELAGVEPVIVASNRTAVDAAADAARELGWQAQVMTPGLRGDASRMGREVGMALDARADAQSVFIWGGETTVTIGAAAGTGGRAQELALAAASELAQRDRAAIVLSAGTDGRDGPTDAAGAIVDGKTWGRIEAAGRDPGKDLAQHDAYPALDAVGALMRTGPTGTNVTDLVLGTTP